MDTTPNLDNPPVIIGVIGPPQSGKTTLIRSVVKKLSNASSLSKDQIRGPVTVVSSKKKRFTFLECPNNLSAMIDASKICDLVILIIKIQALDPSNPKNRGKNIKDQIFSLDTFESIVLLKQHGFPRVLGIPTFMDTVPKIKHTNLFKFITTRFQEATVKGAPVFRMHHGIMNGKYYSKKDMQALVHKHLNNTKLCSSTLRWRSTHPHVLIDKFQDITDTRIIEDDPRCPREIAVYGYVRGPSFHQNTIIQIPGAGDFNISKIEALEDPCPLPDSSNKPGRRKIKSNELKVYSPMGNVRGMKIDQDGVFIEVNVGNSSSSSDIIKSEKAYSQVALTPGAQMIQEIKASGGLDTEHPSSSDDEEDISLLGGVPLEQIDHSIDQSVSQNDTERSDLSNLLIASVADDLNDIDFDEFALSEKYSLESIIYEDITPISGSTKSATSSVFSAPQSNGDSLPQEEDESDNDSDGEDFFVKEEADPVTLTQRLQLESWHYTPPDEDVLLVDDPQFLEAVLEHFSSLGHSESTLSDEDENENAGEKLIEDLETSDDDDEESFQTKQGIERDDQNQTRPDDDDIDDETLQKPDEFQLSEDEEEEEEEETPEEEIDEESLILESVTQDLMDPKYHGFAAGTYVRVVISEAPWEMSEYFDPQQPVILGGISPSEAHLGLIHCRFIKHYLFPKEVLKTNDPLILSMGWHRFQTLPTYCIKDSGMNRIRYLKYCRSESSCVFYGPKCPANTGIVAFSSMTPLLRPTKKNKEISSFRVCGTGIVLESADSTSETRLKIVKKLKLQGFPFIPQHLANGRKNKKKTFRHSAFIKDMFTTRIEATRFEGAKIRTVSGIRGQIKKALSKPEGAVRCTFEDKILHSDIVFTKLMVPVSPKKYFHIITTMYAPKNVKWVGMRSIKEIRNSLLIPGQPRPLLYSKDSLYLPVHRTKRRFNPLHVPISLQRKLPFSAKPKLQPKRKKVSYLTKRQREILKSPRERKIETLFQYLATMRNVRQVKEKEQRKQLQEKFERSAQRETKRIKSNRKEFFKTAREFK